MTKDLFIRGLDDEIHKKLTSAAEKKGVSLNSLLKDVADKWAEQSTQITPRHELILYSDEQVLESFLKSVDYASSADTILRACCGSKNHTGMQFLKKQGWLDVTIEPYKEFSEKPYQYTGKVLQKVGAQLENKSLFSIAFLADELSEKKSLHSAKKFCHWYDQKGVPGSTFCLINYKNVLKGDMDEMLDFFDTHDQVFIVRKNGFFKIHVSEESIHKLFLN
ncbi:MAG TPA: hypothetical protein VD731_06465 [Nitrosopumilaceae archaeon]|nr:hypothetical protein [Nitrosopumilaceae archaeon]